MTPFNFLYITDTHFKGKTPRSRTDDYLETGLKKLQAVIDYAIKNKVSTIIHGGDFFDGPVSMSVWYKFAEVIANHRDIDWWSNVGQHDLDSHSHASLTSMPLGCLGMIPNFHILPNNQRETVGNAGRMPVNVIGRWYDHKWQADPGFYVVDPDPTIEFLILTSHGLLVDEPFFGNYVELTDLPASSADLFLASDYHPGWKEAALPCLKNLGMTEYRAPGSLMRPAKPASKRMPSLLHFRVEENKTFQMISSFITTDFPFKEEAPALVKEHLIEDELYVGLVDKIETEHGKLRYVEPEAWISQIVTELGISEPVHKRTLELLSEGKAQLA